MKAKKEKELIISLIKDDMINAKLVRGLNALGLDAGNYFLHLSETIFSLIGFKDDEKSEGLYEEYLLLTKQAMPVDIAESDEPLDALALEIYLFLKTKKGES